MPKEEGSHILDTEWVLMVICNMNANVRCEVLTNYNKVLQKMVTFMNENNILLGTENTWTLLIVSLLVTIKCIHSAV